MCSSSINSLLAYCNQDDPLKEFWLWAQAIGLAGAITVIEFSFLSIFNLVVISYTAIMAKLCSMEFNLNPFTAWQDNVGSISLITGLTIASSAAFLKLWLVAYFGSAAVKRNVHLALGLEDTVRLCLSLLPPDAVLRRGVPVGGQLTLNVQLGRSGICTRHLVIRTLYVDTDETAVMIDAVPVLNSQWGLLSAFFTDFGRNREEVENFLMVLRPYMSNMRRRLPSSVRKKAAKGPSQEQILKEAPPTLSQAKGEAKVQRPRFFDANSESKGACFFDPAPKSL
jgi:hypothetical protein